MSVNDHAYVIIGGSTKCATTSVFSYLADHPQISGSKIKESRFFWKGNYDLKKGLVNIDDGIESYDGIFLDKLNAKYRLEATPDYLYSVNSAGLIRSNLKDVRLIFIVRDPIDRVISWFKFAKQLNLISSTQTIDEFITDQLNLDNDIPRMQHLHAVEQGRYGIYLEFYIRLFGQDKIKVMSYEELRSNPLKSLNDICSFINIDPSFYNDYDFKILNQSVKVGNPKAFNKYRDFRRKLRRTFKYVIPSDFRNTFKRLFKKVDSIYMSSATSDFDDIIISEEIKNKLVNYYIADKATVKSIINN